MVPRFGSASRPGSKPARSRPDDQALAAQLLGAARASAPPRGPRGRASSRPARPRSSRGRRSTRRRRGPGRRPPAARRAWCRRCSARRGPGTARPRRRRAPSRRWRAAPSTRAMRSTTPSENGSGCIAIVDRSQSASAWASSSPVGCSSNQRSGHAEVAVGDPPEPEHLHPPLGHLAEVAPQHHADHPERRAGRRARRRRSTTALGAPRRRPRRPGVSTSSVIRPSTTVPPTAITENSAAPTMAIAKGPRWARTEYQSRRAPAPHDRLLVVPPCHRRSNLTAPRRSRRRNQRSAEAGSERSGCGRRSKVAGRSSGRARRSSGRRRARVASVSTATLEAGQAPPVGLDLERRGVGDPADGLRAAAGWGRTRPRAGARRLGPGSGRGARRGASRPCRRAGASARWRGGTGPGPGGAVSPSSAPIMSSSSSQPGGLAAGRVVDDLVDGAGAGEALERGPDRGGHPDADVLEHRRHAHVVAVGDQVGVERREAERAARRTTAPATRPLT